ncbi:MAG: sodium:calcium antiporter, partial [bacterium]|nr:sodium:calcium antiporter [bacterium]
MAKMLLNLAVLVASAIVLSRSSVYLIDRLTRIAIKLRVSEYLVGFVIMAVATSLPELAVGITSAIDANPTLSLGNVLGSNILNLTLVLGLAALVAGGLRLETQVRNREVFYMDLIALSPLVLLLDGRLSRAEGVVLLILFVIYMYTLIFQSREYHKVYKNHKRDGSIWKELALLLLGTAVLVGSADVLVRSAQELALALNMPEIIIGIFLIALSTSLPEIATSIPAAIRRQG